MDSLNAGLVSYWNLQDQSGSRLDLTGAGNTLTNTNTVTSVDGFIGQASNFVAASSQRLTVASNATLQGGPQDYTFACWVQLATKPANAMIILSKYSATSGQAEYIINWDNTLDRFTFTVYRATDSANQIAADNFGAPSTSTWYFVVGWNDNGNLQTGIEVNAGDANTLTLGGATQAASAAAFGIGSLSLVGSFYLNGKMAEVGLWKRVLTKQERTWLYNKGFGRTFPFNRGNALGLGRHQHQRRGMVQA